MKTTSLEISKQLQDAGFEAPTNCFWDLETEELQVWHAKPERENFLGAYCLETILKALPPFFDLGERYLLTLRRNGLVDSVGYCRSNGNHHSSDYVMRSESGESLTDVAAKLLIQLVEEGLINFTEGKIDE